MLSAVFGAPEAIIVLVVILVLFGGAQIPKMARNLGQAQKEFKKGLSEGQAAADEESKPAGTSNEKSSSSGSGDS
jgi:sec-independent protein translocase protein TatA